MKDLKKVTLDNGLTIFLYSDKKRHSTLFQFITKFGGITKDFIVDGKEYHMQDGIAHILEHYIVECNNKGNFIELLGKRQMNTNASTYYDMTNFYFNAVEDVEYGINTLLEGINNVEFSTDKLENLKNPICQEIRGKSDSKFYQASIEKLNSIFNNFSFRSIGGTLDEIMNTTIDDLKICYEAFYQPNNQYIVVAGSFDEKKVINSITNFYKNKTYDKHDLKIINIVDNINVKKKKSIVYHPTPEEYINISFKIDISKYSPIQLLDLDFCLKCFYNQFFRISSPIYKYLIDNKIITTSINCAHQIINNFIIIDIGSYTSRKQVFEKAILDVIKKLDSFNKEDFELDKKNTIMNLILRDENIIRIIVPFINNLVSFNYPYLDTVQDIERIQFNDYKKYIIDLCFDNYSVIVIKNPKSK